MFLQKGFQAFLPKPVEIARLDSIIREWVRDKKLEKQLSGKFISSGIPGIDIRKGLERFSGDEESYMEVLRSYAVNTRPLLEQLKIINRDNISDYAIAVHGLKGSNRGICADELGNRAEALETAAKEGNLDFIKANNGIFLEATGKMLDFLDNLIRQHISNTSKPKKERADPEMLKKLVAACGIYDMDGVDSAMAEIEAYEYTVDNELVSWLRENVDQVNFAQIKERLANE
jgi:HPt (histidine-containing phosphotransfer) domain-containing protein